MVLVYGYTLHFMYVIQCTYSVLYYMLVFVFLNSKIKNERKFLKMLNNLTLNNFICNKQNGIFL